MIQLIDKAQRKRDQNKKWRLNNPEKVKLMKRKYEDTHREYINAYSKNYRLNRLRYPKPIDTEE